MTNPAEKIPEAPAILRPNHRQDREISTVAGAPKAWRSESTLEAFYDMGRLNGGSSKFTAEDRYQAGLAYSEIFDTSESSGSVDSTQSLNVVRSSNLGRGNDAKSRAWDARIAIESHLGQRDRIIVRMVCGENFTPAEAVRMVCNDYRDTVSARFREALDALIEAIETTRRMPGRASLAIVP